MHYFAKELGEAHSVLFYERAGSNHSDKSDKQHKKYRHCLISIHYNGNRVF